MYHLIRKVNGREEVLITDLTLSEACQFWIALAKVNPGGFYWVYFGGTIQ